MCRWFHGAAWQSLLAMTLYWILYCYVTLTSLICCVNKGGVVYIAKPIFLNLLLIVLIIFSGFREYEVDVDSANYIDWFREIKNTIYSYSFEMKDPAFYIISYLVISFGFGVSYLFLSYATIALWSKFQLVKHFPYIKYPHIFLYLYFSRFFFVHDMTQIRTGAAVGLASFALILLYKNKIYLGFVFLFAAITFHLSVILIIPFFLLILFGYRFESRILLIFVFVLALIIGFYSEWFLNILDLNEIIRIGVYFSGEYALQNISLLSVYFIAKVLLMLWLVISRWYILNYFDRLIIFLVMAGIFFQVTLINNDALALRLAEVFSIFDLILFIIPLGFLTRNTRFFYLISIYLMGLIFFMSSLKIMQPYKSIIL